nr:SDR family oxidoreductase [Bradyrhizobium betae]
MIARKSGRIVYITGKSEPEGLSREIGEHGITINCIPPGRIMSEQIRRNYAPDYRERFAEEEIPVGYWGEPEDLAALVVFLASPVARYITGTVIPVDGGLRRYQLRYVRLHVRMASTSDSGSRLCGASLRAAPRPGHEP